MIRIEDQCSKLYFSTSWLPLPFFSLGACVAQALLCAEPKTLLCILFFLFQTVQVIVQARLGEKICTRSSSSPTGSDWVSSYFLKQVHSSVCVLRTPCDCYSLVQTIIIMHRIGTIFSYVHWWCCGGFVVVVHMQQITLDSYRLMRGKRNDVSQQLLPAKAYFQDLLGGPGDEFLPVRSLIFCKSGLFNNGL